MYLGEIDTRTGTFIPDETIEGLEGVSFDAVIEEKLRVMEYRVKEPALSFISCEEL